MTKQEFLAMSLPYGIYLLEDAHISKLEGIVQGYYLIDYNEIGTEERDDVLPILHPLSDLDAYSSESPMNLSISLAFCSPYSLQRVIENRIVTNTLLMVDALELIRHHFDIADLISKGEAIDINTLEANPYK